MKGCQTPLHPPFVKPPFAVFLKSQTKSLADPEEGFHDSSSGEAFLLAAGAFLLTAKLLCLQYLKALIRHTFPLQAKKLQL